MFDMIKRKDLIVANTLPCCKGLITRQRVLENSTEEKAVLDYIIADRKFSKYLTDMTIDENQNFSLFRTIKHKASNKIVYSDHNVIVGNFSLEHEQKVKPKRQEIYNFKDPIGKEKIFLKTSLTNKFTDCIENGTQFEKVA